MNTSPIRLSQTVINQFWATPINPHLRIGQAFHQYFQLNKLVSAKARHFADELYNADDIKARGMIEQITDFNQ